MHKLVTAAALTALLALGPGLAAADETATETGPASTHQALIDGKAGAVVSLKFVLNVNINFQGQQMNREVNQQVVGVVVDASGFVMVPASAFDVSMNLPPQVDATSTPVNIRVIFPGDDKEYPAILGAKDSKLGLAFVLIKDLGDKKPTVVDLANTAEPAVGDTLYGVSRLDQGFDHAPICSEVRVIGKVTKPRTMWALAGTMQFLAEPLYTADGAVTGVCIAQSGVGSESQSVFLLPLEVAAPTVKRAKREADRALDELLEAEEEAAARRAEQEAAAKEAAGEGDEGGDEDADEGGDEGGDGNEPGK